MERESAVAPVWGTSDLTLGLPGGVFRCAGLSESQVEVLEPRFGAWRVGRQPDVHIEVRRAPQSSFDLRTVSGEVSTFEHAFDADRVQLSGFDLLAVIERESLDAVLLTPVDGALASSVGTPDPRFLDAFENLLRVLCAYRCLQQGGALLHSSGVLTERGVHLFIGPSGAGKTTVARLSQERGLGVLSDDINLVLPADGAGSFAQRLPFAGELGNGLPARPGDRGVVVGLHRLVQGPRHELRALSGGSGLAALLGSCPFVNSDPFALDRLIANLEPLQDLVTELSFRRDADFWQLLSPSRQEVLV
ncbi:MAG: hypothetical protein AAGK22_16035 [Acidobacteriota bacterium]